MTACGLGDIGPDRVHGSADVAVDDALDDAAETAEEVATNDAADVVDVRSDGDAAEVGEDAEVGAEVDAAVEVDAADVSEVGPDAEVSPDGDDAADVLDVPPECTASTDCGDDNACTIDNCDNGTCSHSAVGNGYCTDNNACTIDDCTVLEGCVHAPIDVSVACDDSDACTADGCDVDIGCISVPFGTLVCDDNSLCTTDGCAPATGCVHNEIVCKDQNPCTVDSCKAATGCDFSAVTSTYCDDGDPCTADACTIAEGCIHPPVDVTVCDDNEPCTHDLCATGSGCVNVPWAATECADEDLCNGDKCEDGKGCVHFAFSGTPSQCEDNNACTVDSCDVSLGCAHTPVSADACADDDQCTQDFCDTAAGCLHDLNWFADCNDGSACTFPDVCLAIGKCNGYSAYWSRIWDDTGGAKPVTGQWIASKASAVKYDHRLIGWSNGGQETGGYKFRITVQHVNADGTSNGDPIIADDTHRAVVSTVTDLSAGTDLSARQFIQGVEIDNQLYTHPYFAWLEPDLNKGLLSDHVVNYATYEPLTVKQFRDLPLSAATRKVPDLSGTGTIDRVYTVAEVTGGLTFFSIDEGQAPIPHAIGKVSDGCKPVVVRDTILVGICTNSASTTLFQATYADDGTVSTPIKSTLDTGTFITPTGVSLRSDGTLIVVGNGQVGGNANAILIVGIDPAGKVLTEWQMYDTSFQAVYALTEDGPDMLIAGTRKNTPFTTDQIGMLWRLDDRGWLISAAEIESTTPGQWFGVDVDYSGIWLVGGASSAASKWNGGTNSPARVARVDRWGYVSCAQAGMCTGFTPETCDDGNLCTHERCLKGPGCIHDPDILPCSDNEPCTSGDVCKNSACTAGSATNCDDSNACTSDACTDGIGCVHTAITNGTTCDDGSPCSQVDTCANGICVGSSLKLIGTACGDGEVCSANGKCVTPWASSIAAGFSHNCAVRHTSTSDNGVWCWGSNDSGQLGLGSTGESIASTDTALRASGSDISGDLFHIAVGYGASMWWEDKYGSAASWGRIDKKQTDLKYNWTAGITYSSVPAAPFNLGTPVSVGFGNNHGCAISSDGSTKCWGDNTFGQIGDNGLSGTSTYAVGPVGLLTYPVSLGIGGDTSCIVEASNYASCWGQYAGWWGSGVAVGDNFSMTPVAVSGLPKVEVIAVGSDHACAIAGSNVNVNGGAVWCWGNDALGQLGDGTAEDSLGTPGIVGLSTAVTAIALGDQFGCALAIDGTVACWGRGTSGQLGDGLSTSSATPVSVFGLNHVIQITARSQHACALRVDGSVYCWGSGPIPGGSSAKPVAFSESLP